MSDGALSEILLYGENRKPIFGDYRDSPYWNIFFLAIAWSLTLTTSTLFTTIGPLSAVHLNASDSLAAFTVGVFLIGAAISSVPSGWLFRTYGRLIGFSVGCFCQMIGSALGSLAMLTSNLYLLYFSCLFIGLGQGLGQFYRFSAVEISPPALKASAVTYVLAGGVIAAFLGPTSASVSINLFPQEYQGSFLLIAFIGVLNLFTIMFVKFPTNLKLLGNEEKEVVKKCRTTWEIVSQPLFFISCSVATLAHTNMVMTMSNVSVYMEDKGYPFADTALVMELHFFAMFSPGFITGMMISRIGAFAVAMIGGILFALSSMVLVMGTQFWNFVLGMILVGIAWNFSFSAGTVMLTKSYLPHEATEVQAINDFILFSVAGSGSLISGVMYADFGWLALIIMVSALMGMYILLFAVIYCYSINVAELAVDEEDTNGRINNNTHPSIGSLSDTKSEESTSFLKRNDSRSNSVPEGVPYNQRSKSLSEFIVDYERHISFSSTLGRAQGDDSDGSFSVAFVRTLSVT